MVGPRKEFPLGSEGFLSNLKINTMRFIFLLVHFLINAGITIGIQRLTGFTGTVSGMVLFSVIHFIIMPRFWAWTVRNK